jgi:phosphoglycolate phosphatase
MAERDNTEQMLLLFDIDGTLLRNASEEHARSIYVAMHEVYGLGSADGDPASMPRVLAAGRTDLEIAREMALLSGCSAEAFDDGRAEFVAVCVREYCGRVPDDLSGRAVDGVRELLAALEGTLGVMLALVTGNIEGIAHLKLARAGLGSFFPSGQGGFGSDSEDRTDLPEIARARAARHPALDAHPSPSGHSDVESGQPYPRERTVVIGDTPLDIACARADGVRCVAVTTGPFGAEDLGGADAVACDTAELREILLGDQLRTSRL